MDEDLSHEFGSQNGLLEKLPATKKLKDAEGHLSRERVLEADEYKALLDASPRWLQRCIIGASEACLSRVDLLTLTVDELHRKRREAALIKLTGGRRKMSSNCHTQRPRFALKSLIGGGRLAAQTVSG